VVVVNDEGALLVIHRSDNDNWAFPGGAMDLGESLVTTAVREVKEETGVDCEITGLVGIYTDPKHIILYTSNGETRQEFSVLFTARPTGGTPTPSRESRQVRWIPREQILDLRMDRLEIRRIQPDERVQDQPGRSQPGGGGLALPPIKGGVHASASVTPGCERRGRTGSAATRPTVARPAAVSAPVSRHTGRHRPPTSTPARRARTHNAAVCAGARR